MRGALRTLTVAWLLGLALGSGASAHAALPPLDPTLKATLGAVVPDPEPESLTRDTHYWICNEDALELFEPHVRGLGGALVGVGTDQNFIFAGWARSELLVLMDFDQAIGDLHRVYAAAFTRADSPEAFVALWSKEGSAALRDNVAAMYPDPATSKRAQRALKAARGAVERRLRKTMRHMKRAGVSTFLDDADQYAHVRSLFTTGRVSIHRGDLTKQGTLRALGQALKQGNQVVRVYYPSNAEQYFDYLPEYRDNVRGLPRDAKSVVIRTLGWGKIYGKADATYHYNVQSLDNFALWLDDPRIKHAGRLLRYRTPGAVEGFSTLDQRPGPDAKAAPRRKEADGPDDSHDDAPRPPVSP